MNCKDKFLHVSFFDGCNTRIICPTNILMKRVKTLREGSDRHKFSNFSSKFCQLYPNNLCS